MGKKKEKEKVETEMVAFRCSSALAKRLKIMSEKGEISRAKLILNICEMSLDGLEACEKVGLLQLGLLFRDMEKKIAEWSSDMKGKSQIPINNK